MLGDPPPTTSPTLTIRRFEKALHDRSAFSCGRKPIDNFLKSSLSESVKDGMVAAYMATAEGAPSVVGFYTLSAMAVRSEFGPAKWQKTRAPDVPVIYIRAIAVHLDHQGKRLGTALLIDAMRRCVDISRDMGAAAIVLDALRDGDFARRFSFYESLGFQPLGDPDNPDRVYISMRDVAASLGSPSVTSERTESRSST
jgi:GNAT superfamily N-acetyltransferase